MPLWLPRKPQKEPRSQEATKSGRKKPSQVLCLQRLKESGRLELNQRPLGPEKGPAPTRKSYLRFDAFVVYAEMAKSCKPLQTYAKSSKISW